MFYLQHLSLKIESLFIFYFLWRRSLIYHVCFSHTVAFSSHVIMVCFSLTISLSTIFQSLFVCFLWRRILRIICVFAHKSLSHTSHTQLIMLCVFPPPSLSQLKISSLFSFYEEESWGLYVSLLTNHSLISLTHSSSCCVFFLHHLSLNSKSLHCLVSMKKELLDYVCFSHTISFNTILLATKSMPF
jgi:hypothetical protein